MILLTGASGFLGNSLLKSINKSYRCIRRGENKVNNDKNFYVDSCNSAADYDGVFENVEQVIHMAGVAHRKNVNLDDFRDINYLGTVNFAQQAAESGVKRFIFISTIGVHGTRTTKIPFTESSNIACVSEYTKSKYNAEKELLKISSETGMEIVIIRPPLIYGNGAPGNFEKLVNLVHKLPVLPFGLCNNKRSFISVDNLVDFISVCITHPKAKNETFCISDGNDVSIKEFTDGIAKGLNKRLIQVPIPVSVFKLLGKITRKSELIEQLIGDLQVDSSKARYLLDWTPPVTMTETFSKLSNNK